MTEEKKTVLITGIAGFIGFHFAKRCLADGHKVIGIDNINDYYDVNIKLNRLKELRFAGPEVDKLFKDNKTLRCCQDRMVFYRTDLENKAELEEIFKTEKPDFVFNAAAQAGVRYSLENPHAYISSNITGFLNILENCRHHPVEHLVYASSSSVYGSNESMPFSVHDNVDHPISLYAASKKSNELMAHTYSHLFRIPTTGLRFFTVYGPWGRPDMALFIFTHKIANNEPIEIFNNGSMSRDFTYIDDITEGVYRTMFNIPSGNTNWNGEDPDPATSKAPYRVFNIGNSQPVELMYFIELIEKNLGKKAIKKFLPMQKGDVPKTYADIDAISRATGFKPVTSVEKGVQKFIEWYRDHYNIQS